MHSANDGQMGPSLAGRISAAHSNAGRGHSWLPQPSRNYQPRNLGPRKCSPSAARSDSKRRDSLYELYEPLSAPSSFCGQPSISAVAPEVCAALKAKAAQNNARPTSRSLPPRANKLAVGGQSESTKLGQTRKHKLESKLLPLTTKLANLVKPNA